MLQLASIKHYDVSRYFAKCECVNELAFLFEFHELVIIFR